jgi:inorganic pyrophosphatase
MKFPKAYKEKKGTVNAIIETPEKSRNKYKYHEKSQLFKLSKVLPSGMRFPCSMGFIPRTRGGDGDPLDVLVFMDEFAYPGCLVECRIIGVIRAQQTEKNGHQNRNDRFLAVPAEMREFEHIRRVSDLGKNTLDAVVAFFENYNRMESKRFRKLSIEDVTEAIALIRKAGNGRSD